MSRTAQRCDFSQAAGALLWTVEPKTDAMRRRRQVAFVLTLLGPRAWDVSTLIEVARIEAMPARTLRDLRSELRVVYGLTPPSSVFAAPGEGVNALQESTAPDFAEMGAETEDGFFATDPQGND